MTAYIMTRSRPGNLKKIVPRWLEQHIPVVLVTEPSEREHHLSLVNGQGWEDVTVINPPQERGIGYKRQFSVEHAHSRRLRSIIMSDDDMQPANNSDMDLLLEEAQKPGVLGIGAARSLHDHFSGGATKNNDGVILCPGGWGMQLFALNVRSALDAGNFDAALDCFGEDHELARNGIARLGLPWAVHCTVRCEPVGVRYDPGGINAFITDGTRPKREQACREIIYRRWPRYASVPDARPRMRWQKMLDDYIPGWREFSAMHGGSW